MWAIVVLPFLESDLEEVGIVDGLALEETVELLGVDAVGPLAVESRCCDLIRVCPMPMSSRCQREEDPNSWPLSVWTRSTAKGNLDSTWSLKAMAVGWSLRR